MTPLAPAATGPFVYAVYLVDTDQDANDLFLKFDDASAPGVLLREQGLWPRDASVFSLPARQVSVLVIAGVAQEASAQQLLAASAAEIMAAGGSLQIIDLRAGK